jgi:hypothetical protein
MISGHALSPPLSFVAAVPAARSRSPSLGGGLDLLEAVTTVTECDWMLSHGRA